MERKKGLLLIYLVAEIIGALLASIFIYSILGNENHLGANAPNYLDFPIHVIVGIEILASALLMSVILIVVYTKGLKRFSRNSNWCYSRFRYFLVWFNIWGFNESCSFFGTCYCVRLLY